jgi:3',5'-cyclic AMP phosphodiesterase CpdA
VNFPLAPSPFAATWRFAHLSDTHLDPSNVGRLRSALALAASKGADMGVVSGDLVKDALRVDEATARAAFALYVTETAKAPFPLHHVLGNHDVFGIERHESLVPRTHPAYGKALYEETLGPRCYAFNRGRIHFLVLDTIGIDDLWYYGLLDKEQLDFIRNDLAHVPEGTTVVSVGHIPLRVGALATAFHPEGPARTLHTVDGVTSYRHVVRNAAALEELLKPYRWTLALQGHTHLAERLRMWDGGITRFFTAPAVDRQPWAPGLSGIVVYGVKGDEIDDGDVLAIDGK